MFQSTPARGGRPTRCPRSPTTLVFQSTPARGGRLYRSATSAASFSVSIHARAGRATSGHRHHRIREAVSIHARAGRATRVPAAGPRGNTSFNPRPRGAGDGAFPVGPAGRARVSIHARAGRATRVTRSTTTGACTFQSTPARGGRRAQPCPARHGRAVSIHARAGRATPGPVSPAPCAWRFNPRPRGAGDWSAGQSAVDGNAFQSTPARGGRHLQRGVTMDERRVSIHARAGRATAGQGQGVVRGGVSIHARAGRATRWFAATPRSGPGFNPRPRGAGDVLVAGLALVVLVSIHARAGRATWRLLRGRGLLRLFQSTPARGGRHPR